MRRLRGFTLTADVERQLTFYRGASAFIKCFPAPAYLGVEEAVGGVVLVVVFCFFCLFLFVFIVVVFVFIVGGGLFFFDVELILISSKTSIKLVAEATLRSATSTRPSNSTGR